MTKPKYFKINFAVLLRKNRTEIYQLSYQELKKKLNINKAIGPDEIHPRMLKELVDYITIPLFIIMKKSLVDGTLPTDWKLANVSPIFKKGSKNLAENYRPISLTSIVCRLMEKIMKCQIMDHQSHHTAIVISLSLIHI